MFAALKSGRENPRQQLLASFYISESPGFPTDIQDLYYSTASTTIFLPWVLLPVS